jgi:hypothetical protein
MDSTSHKTDPSVSAVLPLRGLWRAGLLAAWDFQALDRAGLSELGELAQWNRADLMQLPGFDRAAVARVESLLARYCLTLCPSRRTRLRGRRRLDPR